MKSFQRLAIICLLLLIGAPLSIFASERLALPKPEPATPERTPARPDSRELFVPYSELEQAVGTPTDAMVMTLEEYRTLAALAYANERAAPVIKDMLPLPRATFNECVLTGVVIGDSAVIDATFSVSVADDQWATILFGMIGSPLGKLTLDGKPAYAVTDGGCLFMPVKGAGEHTGTMRLLLPVVRDAEIAEMSVLFPPAAAKSMSLTVPGRVEPLSDTAARETYDPATDKTIITLAPAGESAIKFRWRQIHGSRESDSIIEADQTLAATLSRAASTVVWNAKVTVHRRNAERLAFNIPPALQFISISGPDVLDWTFSGERLFISLKQPKTGVISITGTGIITGAPVSGADDSVTFRTALPVATGAIRDTGLLTLSAPADAVVTLSDLRGLTEIVGDAKNGVAVRRFISSTPGASLTVALSEKPSAYDAQTLVALTVGDSASRMIATMTLTPETGRIFSVRLITPAGWTVTSLTERKSKLGAAFGRESDESNIYEITLDNPATATSALDIRIIAELPRNTADAAAPVAFDLDAALPYFESARRMKTTVGVSIDSSWLPSFKPSDDWRARSASALEELGFATVDIRAGFETDSNPPPPVSMTLEPKRVRGEYHCVTHIFVSARALNVRSDIRLAVFDQPIRELEILAPSAGSEPVHITGDGISEVIAGADGKQTVRFAKPWLGSRMLRVEYRGAPSPDSDSAIPEIQVTGSFYAERRVVFQSAGGIELSVKPSSRLDAASIDDTPSFALPFDNARALHAFVIDDSPSSTGAFGTFRTHIHPRTSDAVAYARELELTTVFDESGVSRTRARCSLTGVRGRTAILKLPVGAELLSVAIDGGRAQAMAAAEPNAIAVPLPTRSAVELELTYEIRRVARSIGSSVETAPVIADAPIGETRWEIYAPETLIIQTGGNLKRADAPTPSFFVLTYLKGVFGKSQRRWTAWESTRRSADDANNYYDDYEPQYSVESYAPKRAVRSIDANESLLQSREAMKTDAAETGGALYGLAIPEGRRIVVSKLGGDAVLKLSWRDQRLASFIAQTVFVLTLLAVGALAIRKGARQAIVFCIAGLVIGSLLPYALNWESPMLALPFCESLTLALPLLLIWVSVRWVKRLVSRSTTRRSPASSPSVSSIIIIACMSLLAASSRADAQTVNNAEPDRVVIPYNPEVTGTPDAINPADAKAYVSKSVFERLINLALPDPEDALPDQPYFPPVPSNQYSLLLFGLRTPAQFVDAIKRYQDDRAASLPVQSKGNSKARPVPDKRLALLTAFAAQYQTHAAIITALKALSLPVDLPRPVELTIANARYKINVSETDSVLVGAMDIRTYRTDEWTVLPLDYGDLKIDALVLDGRPAQVSTANGIPFIVINGAGEHTLAVRLRVRNEQRIGRIIVKARLVGGPATLVSIQPAAGLEIDNDSLKTPYEIVETRDGVVTQLHLGNGGDIVLNLRAPEVKATSAGVRQTAREWTLLTLSPGGCRVGIEQRIESDGEMFDNIEWTVLGDWTIADATAADLTEWESVPSGGSTRLRLWFAKPLSSALIKINGWMPLPAGASVQVPSLVLPGAAHQDGFIGLNAGERDKFTARSLDGLPRASVRDAVSPSGAFDAGRVHRCLRPPEGILVSAERKDATLVIRTSAVARFDMDSVALAVKSIYEEADGDLLRHEVSLPVGWEFIGARGEALSRFDIIGTPADGSTLVAQFKSGAKRGSEIIWTARCPLPVPRQPGSTVRFDAPSIRCVSPGIAPDLIRETTEWMLAADASVSIAELPETTMRSTAVSRLTQWIDTGDSSELRSAYNSTRVDDILAVSVGRQDATVDASIAFVIRASASRVQVNARIRYDIARASRDRFSFRLPPGAILVDASAENIRERRTVPSETGDAIELLTHAPVSGEQSINVIYRIPRRPNSDVVVSGLILTDAAIRRVERTVALLAFPSGQGLLEIAGTDGLTPSAANEHPPFQPENIGDESVQRRFNAVEAWRLTLTEPKIQVQTGPAAEISLAVIQTVVTNDGKIRNVANYTIRNRSLQFLKIEMPANAEIWSVSVDGLPVTVSRIDDGGATILLVPLRLMTDADLPVDARLVWADPSIALPALTVSFSLSAPRMVDAPVVETFRQLVIPDNYRATRTGGSMRDAVPSIVAAAKIKQNVRDAERMQRVFESTATIAIRERARANITDVNRALLDNARDYDVYSVQLNRFQNKEINEADMTGQMEYNVQQRTFASEWEKKLSSDTYQRTLTRADLLTDEQLDFRNALYLNQNRWTPGSAVRKPAPSKKLTMDSLLGSGAQGKFESNERLRPSGPAMEIQLNARENDHFFDMDGVETTSVSGVTDIDIPSNGAVYTYRGVDALPDLTVRLRSVDATYRLAAGIAFIVFAVAFGWIALKRKKAA